ncbi:hypothetical protein [Mucilaginibacter sp.]|nr:hypothetical protein [Mucilaginibacter sp.]
MAERTHPDLASLVDPLFAARKEGKLQFPDNSISLPYSTAPVSTNRGMP